MASYRKRQGKWQAQVRLAGKPAISKTFPTRDISKAKKDRAKGAAKTLQK